MSALAANPVQMSLKQRAAEIQPELTKQQGTQNDERPDADAPVRAVDDAARVPHAPRGVRRDEVDERGAELLCRVGGTAVQVTLSHTETTAMAVAVVLAGKA